jgi:hypothetical protein
LDINEETVTEASIKAFADQAIMAVCSGAQVDFDNEIILDPTFVNNQRVICIFNKLLSLNTDSYFKNTIANLFGSTDVSNVKFSIANLPNNFDAVTLPSYPYNSPGNSLYNIVLNSSFVNNASNIEIALTLIHELMHAELIERCIRLGILNSVTVNSNYNAIYSFANGLQIPSTANSLVISAMINQYLTYNGAANEWNHNLMTAFNYSNILSQNLQLVYPLINDLTNDFINNINNDPNNTFGNFTLQQAMYHLSWIGLEQTQDYINNIQNVPAELNKNNYIYSVRTIFFNNTCH